MSTEEKEDKVKIPKFSGEKDEYAKWKIRVSQWEKKKKLTYLTTVDKTDELPTTMEYDHGTRLVIGADGAPQAGAALTDDEKKLYEDNAAVLCKLMECVCDDLLVPLQNAGGPKESVFKVKEWLERQYGEVEAEDTLKDLRTKLAELHPADFEDSMYYLSKLEDLNTKIAKVGSKYAMDELELKLEVLAKLPNVSDDKPNEKWGGFQGVYLEKNKLNEHLLE